MSFWVYILHCADSSYYTGHTDNLEKRIGEHQHGLCGGYTAARLPVELLFSRECSTREEALAAEQQIKGWSRKKKEAMMRGDWAEVSRLAMNSKLRGALVHPSTSSGRTEVSNEQLKAGGVSGEPFDAVRPELVEGENGAQESPVEP